MHETRKKLLSLAQLTDISSLSYRQIALKVGSSHAAQVRHHLMRLIADGMLVRDEAGKLKPATDSSKGDRESLVSIPVLGDADCGEATKFATDDLRGYLTISPSNTTCREFKNVFSLKACGDSMDKTQINGKAIEDGDYLLVEKYESGHIEDGECIVSLIDGLANVKRFYRDHQNHRVVLMSESYRSYPPIIIAEGDLDIYHPVGRVRDVIKGVSHLG